MSATVNVMEKTVEAARKAGAAYPEAVAECLRDNLTTVYTVAGEQIVVRNGLEVEPLDFVFSKMKVTENVGALFGGGKPDPRTMDHELYRVVRKCCPELIGLRKRW